MDSITAATKFYTQLLCRVAAVYALGHGDRPQEEMSGQSRYIILTDNAYLYRDGCISFEFSDTTKHLKFDFLNYSTQFHWQYSECTKVFIRRIMKTFDCCRDGMFTSYTLSDFQEKDGHKIPSNNGALSLTLDTFKSTFICVY